MGFNTAIAALMELVNELYKLKLTVPMGTDTWNEALTTLVKLIAPFAPHITEELWQQLGHEGSVHTSDWPTWDDSVLVSDTITVVVQVNGKLRGEVSVGADATEDAIIAAAKENTKAKVYLDGKDIRKAIYVPGKLVNFVV
ncbi:MAG: leuS [Candidatus Saccharibacteria bacterium]|nr:leuS [Candidatus Saccharibacteria bacterium]